MTLRYLLDTNHLSAALAPVSSVRERIYQAHRAGIRVGTCAPALCELEVGIRQTKDPTALRRHLARLFMEVRIWPLTASMVEHYGEIFIELRQSGRVMSQVDIMLAALASEMDLTIATADRDFEALPNIPTENWIKN